MSQKRVVIYARVSTAEQAEEGYSIDAQLETVRKISEGQGKVVVKEYVDRGISGKSIKNRLALQELLKDSSKGMFDEVVVWKTNRLARNHLDLLKMVEVFNGNNVAFRSVTEPFETSTPAGKLLMNMLASIGEFERDTIVDNVKMGMKQRATQGKWNGGKVLGYKSVKVDVGNETKLEIVPEEAYIVREIFNMYSKGKGLRTITNELNHKGYKTKKGNPFNVIGVNDILANPIYIGKIRFNRFIDWGTKRRKGKNDDYVIVEGDHEPIITQELWDKVQELHQAKSKKPPRSFDGGYPLSGILKCPMCGAPMVRSRTTNKLKDGSKKVLRYYICSNFKNKGSAVCKSNGVRADYAEEYVFKRIKEVLNSEKVLRDIVANLNKDREEKIKPLEEQRANILMKQKELSRRKNKVLELFEDGVITKATVAERVKAIDEEIETNKRQNEWIDRESENNSSEKIPYEMVKEVMNNYNNLLDKSEPKDKKMLMQLIIKKIIITDRKKIDTIEIHYNDRIRKLLIDNMEEELSENESSSSFYFTIAI